MRSKYKTEAETLKLSLVFPWEWFDNSVAEHVCLLETSWIAQDMNKQKKICIMYTFIMNKIILSHW